MISFIKNHPVRAAVCAIGGIFFIWLSPLCSLRVNEGTVFGMLLGGFILLCGIFGITPKKAFTYGHGITRVLCIAASVCVTVALLGATLAGGFILYKASVKPAEKEQTVIVLGCAVHGETPSKMLTKRLLAAERYLRDNPSFFCILSGGQGDGEAISEAEAMRRFLVSRGIDGDRLLLEDTSENTEENLKNSAALIEQKDLPKTVAIVTQSYHQGRAAIYAENAGLLPGAVNAGCDAAFYPTYFIRDLLGVGEYYVSLWLGTDIVK